MHCTAWGFLLSGMSAGFTLNSSINLVFSLGVSIHCLYHKKRKNASTRFLVPPPRLGLGTLSLRGICSSQLSYGGKNQPYLLYPTLNVPPLEEACPWRNPKE